MGMDIYLYEVCKGKDCKEEMLVDENYDAVEYPEWLKEHITMGDEEFIDYDKIAKEHGLNIEDWEYVRWLDDGIEIKIADKVITITDKEIDEKYTYIKNLPHVKVREIDYARYGAFGDNFTEGNDPYDDRYYEKMKKEIPIFVWFPEDMDRLTHIFRDPSDWKRIQRRFREEMREGNRVFVYISW